MKKLILAITVCVATALSVYPLHAQQARQRGDAATFLPARTAMKEGESYYITYSCRVRVNLNDYIAKKQRLWRPISAATLVFSVVDGTTHVDSGLFVPGTGNAISPKVVFSVASDRGIVATNDPASCNGSLIAQKSDMPKLAYFLKFNRGTVPSAISTAISAILTAVTPIFKLVKDNTMADKDAENLEQVQTLLTQYNAYLALFTAPESISKAEFLKVGENVLETEAATVTVTVKKVNSFLLDDVPFTTDYKKLFTTHMTYVADNLGFSCMFARSTLTTAGFRNPDDQAYIIYRSLDASVIDSEDDIVKCLERDLVKSVVKNRHLYLRHFPDALVVSDATLKKISALEEAEKVDANIKAILGDIASIAGSSKGGVIPQDLASGLAQYAEDSITVTDVSGDQILSPRVPIESIKSITTGTINAQLARLVSSKYTRFGCFVLTRREQPLDGLLDGATAVMLANRPATKEEATRTVAIRLFIKGTKLTGFKVSDNWIPETRVAYARDGHVCPI